MEGNETNNGEFCDWKTLSGKRGAEDEIQFLAIHFKMIIEFKNQRLFMYLIPYADVSGFYTCDE